MKKKRRRGALGARVCARARARATARARGAPAAAADGGGTRADGLALHLFDPVTLRAVGGRYGGPPEETLVRFIKCRSQATREEMNERIQRALRANT